MLELATDFVRSTSANIYLTGKAGTGKTTFLKTVIPSSGKKYIVVAPTGVAAINAGGVTIHSMFGLPTKSFIPENDQVDPNIANNPGMLMRHFHFNREKLNLLNELELMVIDEISMVRADILDAVDLAMRSARRSVKPFGGVQVLFIGDLFQLSPVVKEDERALLSKYYNGWYFFYSKVYPALNPVSIELDTIYRQQDQQFVSILNNIRHAEYSQEDHEILQKNFNPEFEADEPGYITLTTHNAKAEQMNEKELTKLPGKDINMYATINKDFPDNMFPTERVLRLKVGAQVMFVKNDTSGEKLYFNGKIGTVTEIEEDKIYVQFHDEGNVIEVSRETWENKRYKAAAEKIEEEVLGTFAQFPIRLAWAITIHKSQGLTFDKAIIDAGSSFAPGQVYVALSRCRSMDGLVLKSEITPRSIRLDQQVIDFSEMRPKKGELMDRLYEEQQKYARTRLMSVFSMDRLHQKMVNWYNDSKEHTTAVYQEMADVAEECKIVLSALEDTALRFRSELNGLIPTDYEEAEALDKLCERVTKAADYFAAQLFKNIFQPLTKLHVSLSNKSKTRKHQIAVGDLLDIVWHNIDNMYALNLNGIALYTGERKINKLPEAEKARKPISTKPKKGESALRTLELFKEGHSIDEIAEMRGCALSTVEGHLGDMIAAGNLQIEELLNENQISEIEKALENAEENSLSSAKSKLSDEYTFGMIRWVLNAKKESTA
jgi:hypothetical protein